MKINDKQKKTVKFSTIKIGKVFKYENEDEDVYYYMAIQSTSDDYDDELYYNAVDLETGDLEHFYPQDEVIPLPNMELNIN